MRPIFSIQLTEPKLTIDPPPARCMSGATACAAKNWCLRLTAMPASQLSGVVSATLWRWSLAALFISAAIGPKRPRTASTAASSAVVSVRSASTNSGAVRAPGSEAASVRPEPPSMSMKPTFAPWAAKCSTRLAPMPVAPPVTSTTRSTRLG